MPERNRSQMKRDAGKKQKPNEKREETETKQKEKPNEKDY